MIEEHCNELDTNKRNTPTSHPDKHTSPKKPSGLYNKCRI